MSSFIARATLPAPSAKRGDHRRRGMMLVVTLVIVTLLALLGASFAFRMNADVAAVSAQHDLQQARQAAESGLDRAIMILREYRTDMDQWYNNPKSFRRILVWSPDKIGGSESVADQEKVAGRPAWRFSIISYRLDGDDAKIRYGVNDEAGKININTASRSQLIALFDSVKHDDNVTSIDLADAILHWRGDEGVPDETGAKLTDFYNKQNPSYKPKQRPFETVEELLMVKGFDGQLVYGEDYNRNGYLDPNEDDAQDGAFPPDDGDSKLHRGLLPLVTCYSWDRNASNDNRQRININMANLGETPSGEGGAAAPAGMSVRELLSKEIRPEVLDFIAEARKRNFKFRSVGEMVGLEVYQDGSSNYDRMWRSFLRQLNQADKAQANETADEQQNEEDGREGDRDRDGGGRDTGGGRDAGGDDSGDRGGDLGPRRDNTRTPEDRRREQEEKDKDKDKGDSDGGAGRSDAGSGEATIVLAGFTPGAEIFPSVIPSVLLASVDEPVAGDKDARKLQSARGSSRGSSGSSGSGRSGSSRGGSSGRSGGRSFGLDDDKEETGGESSTGSSSGSGRGRGSSGRGSSAGSSRGGSAGGSSGDPGEGSGSGRTGGRRGGGRGSEGSGSGASESGGRGSGRGSGTSGGEGVRGEGRDLDREGGTSSGEGGSGGRRRGGEGGRRGGEEGERRGGERGREGGENGDTAGDNSVGGDENEPQQDNNGAGGGTAGPRGRGTPIISPVTPDDLPALMDQLTTLPMPVLAGQINVNTAPVEVLRTLPGVGEAEAEAIVAKRAQLSGLDKITPAWVVASGALPAEQFALISNLLTARSLQYTVESIGFADHVGAAKRIQAVVEFKGQMAQIKYYRDITSLGIGYPVHDDERSQGFAFSDR